MSAELPMTFGDDAPPVSIYVSWELKNKDGVPLDEAQRIEVFHKYIRRMLVKSCGLTDPIPPAPAGTAKKFVDRVLVPGQLNSCYALVQGMQCKWDNWVVNKEGGPPGGVLQPADHGHLGILKDLCQKELKSLIDKPKSTPGNINLQDPTQQLIMLASALGGPMGGGSGRRPVGGSH